MRRLMLVNGGQKSGKSRFGQEEALRRDSHPLYLATARVWDQEFAGRIARHQADRNQNWSCYESEIAISTHPKRSGIILLDCLTLWLTNVYTDHDYQLDPSLAFAREEWQRFLHSGEEAIVIANEISCGLHAETAMGRRFVDLHGMLVQEVARQADQVVHMVAGLPLWVKGRPEA